MVFHLAPVFNADAGMKSACTQRRVTACSQCMLLPEVILNVCTGVQVRHPAIHERKMRGESDAEGVKCAMTNARDVSTLAESCLSGTK